MAEKKTIDLDELERLEKAATPGEWRAGNVDTDCVFAWNPDVVGIERVVLRTNHHFPVHVPDARFIAAARNALPALIAELRALREALRVGFTCPECGKELDDVVVAHRHSAGNCTESLIGPDVRQYLDAARKGGV